MTETKAGYTVSDRRGQSSEEKIREKGEACRVCGGPRAHSMVYNSPTMDCINYLRIKATRVQVVNKIDLVEVLRDIKDVAMAVKHPELSDAKACLAIARIAQDALGEL